MVDEGIPFTGILYGGLMATRNGVKTIEFNVRFGDPETEVLLPRLISPLDQVIFDVMNHNEVTLEFDPRFCLGVVLASNGYPSTYTKGDPIEGLESLDCPVYHMGTSFDGVYRNAGGRVLCVTNFGSTLENARENVYKEITKLHAPQLFYRRDIGKLPGDKQ
jgi:phosphoribosylamine--glycine ligase